MAASEATGAISAHTVRAGEIVIRKGATIGPGEVTALQAASIGEITVVRLDPGDVGEDDAALALAHAAAGAGVRVDAPFTGRANLFAEAAGLLVVDPAGIDRLNRIDEAVTLATLPAFSVVAAGEMVATAKIIPYAISGAVHQAMVAALDTPVVRIAAFQPRKVALIQTITPALGAKVRAKTRRVTQQRLAAMGSAILREAEVTHEAPALAKALAQVGDCDLVIVFGATAIADRADVVPAAVELAGGRVEHLGMPVDPGNLLMLGELAGRPVIGAPGCARSPAWNGFDLVLARIAVGLPVDGAVLSGMGVGGLLGEIATRGQPRVGKIVKSGGGVAAVVLAAGRSTRMGGPNKLLEIIDGKTLVRRSVEAVVASQAAPVIVVTGHMAAEVKAALAGLPVTFVHNPDFGEGLSTSLKAGIAAVPAGAAGAVVCLGDMPGVDAPLIDRLLASCGTPGEAWIVAPVVAGRRGNPVVWSARLFGELAVVRGDVGARHVIEAHPEAVIEVELDGDGALVDVDTPQALAALRGQLAGNDHP